MFCEADASDRLLSTLYFNCSQHKDDSQSISYTTDDSGRFVDFPLNDFIMRFSNAIAIINEENTFAQQRLLDQMSPQ